MPTRDALYAWHQAHPRGRLTQAQTEIPGTSHTMFYLTRREFRKAHREEWLQSVGAPPTSAMASAEAPSEPKPPDLTTKSGRCIAWLREHPGANADQAMEAGFSSPIFYYSRAKLEGHPYKSGTSRKRRPAVTLMRRRRGLTERPPRERPPERVTVSSQADAVIELVQRLQDELGVEELHFRRGVLEVVQRRMIPIPRGE